MIVSLALRFGLTIRMRFDVLTLFPEIFQGYFTQSILKLALDKKIVAIPR